MTFKAEWYSLEKAVKMLGLEDMEQLIQLLTSNKIRAGIIARGWWGKWIFPDEWNDDQVDFGADDVKFVGDRAIHTYLWQIPGKKDIRLEEFYVCQFWHLHHGETYNILHSSDNETEVRFLEPTKAGHKELLNDPRGLVEEWGLFAINEDEPDRRVTFQNLRIHSEEIDRFSRSSIETKPTLKIDLNHDQELQAKANEIAKDYIEKNESRPTKQSVANQMARDEKYNHLDAGTIERRIRKEW